MHRGFMSWWHARRRGDWCGTAAGCGTEGEFAASDAFGDHPGAGFGVRRPLRYLAYKLELDEAQVAELAKVLDELKIERAQAAVDDRRAVAGIADLIAADAVDHDALAAAAGSRVKTAERLTGAVVQALGRIHALLNPEQRKRLAYLLRSGALSV
ncbi:MAG: Spy/CpxP family protein refolding chaperone [Deltaproteobacteria bacterium]|nr:Spy/CpxP family protein refolding chaperone [Deltaproteobacteria bacterium]